MKRDDYILRARANLANDAFYKDYDLTDSCQECYEEIVVLSGCIFKGALIPQMPRLSFYDLKKFIPDYYAIVAMWNSNGKRFLVPTSKRELESLRWDWTRANGNPLAFYPINHRYIGLFPKPYATTSDQYFHIFYRATASVLSGEDVPEFPQDYDHVLESYITADLHEQQNEYTKAQMYFEESQEHLSQLITYIENQRLPDRLVGLQG